MNKLFKLIIILSAFNQSFKTDTITNLNAPDVKLELAMRKLWADHVFYTREFIKSDVLNSPDAKIVAGRLLKNQEDIGKAISRFYGQEAGKKLTQLLKDHILIGVDIINAAKVNDQAKIKTLDKKWHDNAKQIALFLNKANPKNWSKRDLINMLNDHLKLTTQEVIATVKSDWQGSIDAFDKVFTEILSMADALTAGIVKQFPDKFK